ncbi:hypothetical protein HDU76_013716 [Blyttiomyces sp. JEL0837]|nr:hypothetical protein HDU76_013716 [Blyttiomyces sp. JEL0837]
MASNPTLDDGGHVGVRDGHHGVALVGGQQTGYSGGGLGAGGTGQLATTTTTSTSLKGSFVMNETRARNKSAGTGLSMTGGRDGLDGPPPSGGGGSGASGNDSGLSGDGVRSGVGSAVSAVVNSGDGTEGMIEQRSVTTPLPIDLASGSLPVVNESRRGTGKWSRKWRILSLPQWMDRLVDEWICRKKEMPSDSVFYFILLGVFSAVVAYLTIWEYLLVAGPIILSLIIGARDSNFLSYDIMVTLVVGYPAAIIGLASTRSTIQTYFPMEILPAIVFFISHITSVVHPVLLGLMDEYRSRHLTLLQNMDSFRQVLEDETLFESFKSFVAADLSIENALFWEALKELNRQTERSISYHLAHAHEHTKSVNTVKHMKTPMPVLKKTMYGKTKSGIGQSSTQSLPPNPQNDPVPPIPTGNVVLTPSMAMLDEAIGNGTAASKNNAESFALSTPLSSATDQPHRVASSEGHLRPTSDQSEICDQSSSGDGTSIQSDVKSGTEGARVEHVTGGTFSQSPIPSPVPSAPPTPAPQPSTRRFSEILPGNAAVSGTKEKSVTDEKVAGTIVNTAVIADGMMPSEFSTSIASEGSLQGRTSKTQSKRFSVFQEIRKWSGYSTGGEQITGSSSGDRRASRGSSKLFKRNSHAPDLMIVNDGQIPPLPSGPRRESFRRGSETSSTLGKVLAAATGKKIPEPRPVGPIAVPHDMKHKYDTFYHMYVREGSSNEVNLSAVVRFELKQKAEKGTWFVGDFDKAKDEIVSIMFFNVYPRWISTRATEIQHHTSKQGSVQRQASIV